VFFTKIKGHRDVVSQFADWVLNDKFQGTYLLQGPKGVGKHTISQVLARYLLCTGTQDDSCRCESCRLFPNVPDLMEVDADKNIKVSDIESMEKFLSLLPFKSNKRVVILNDLEEISYGAANGLLKIFEDLKEYAVIISISSNPQKILPTVVSRTSQISFGNLSPDEYVSILKSKGFSNNNLSKLKRAVPYLTGSILSDYNTYLEELKSVPSFVGRLHKMDEDDLIALINQKEQEQSLLPFVEAYILYLNDIMKMHYDGVDALVYEGNFDELVEAQNLFSDELCLCSIEKVRKSLEQYNRGVNVNLKTRVLSAFLWSYTLIQAEKAKKKNESK